MNSVLKPQLQVALDVLSTSQALEVTEEVFPYFDILEIGTPLIIEEGLSALEALKQRFPGKRYLADLKIMDAGYIEAASAFRRGADIVTVLALADDQTIGNALRAAREHGGQIMVDLINVTDCLGRAEQLQEIGVDCLCLHTAFDRQHQDVVDLSELAHIRAHIQCALAVAGGLGLETVRQVIAAGADIAVVGGGILGAADRREAASRIHQALRETNSCPRSDR